MTPPEIYVPYTEVREGTYLYLLQQSEKDQVHWVDVSPTVWSYTDHLQVRWDEGEKFINMEHDIVPWPGALEDLWECNNPWCFFGYRQGIDMVANGAAPFGLVKFDQAIIESTPVVWEEMRKKYDRTLKPWMSHDLHFYEYATTRGYTPHQHYPAVFNGQPPNPKRIDLEKILQWPASTST